MPPQTNRQGLDLAVRTGPGSQNADTLCAAFTMRERGQGAERTNLPPPFHGDREGLRAALTTAAMQDTTKGLANAFPSDGLDERSQGKAWARLLLRLADNYTTAPTPVAKFRDLLIAEATHVHLGTLIPVLEDVAGDVAELLEDLQQHDV